MQTEKIAKFEKLCDKHILSFNVGDMGFYFASLPNVCKIEFNETIQRIRFLDFNFIENFVVPLLQKREHDIKFEVLFNAGGRQIRADIVCYDNKGDVNLVCEIKRFRSKKISKIVEGNIIRQLLKYKSIIKSKGYLLIALCAISEETKKTLLKNGVTVWDIANLLYLCKNDLELTNKLYDLADFPVLDIVPKEPLEPLKENIELISDEIIPIKDTGEEHIARLQGCESGSEDNNDKKYESVCSDIIKYLFENEFKKFDTQHSTEDNIFRMDLLVSIKGNTDFWKFLIQHYNTRFVVFEFKNYKEKISQNLIYITEKYLYNVALRNVAIIVSREGFNDNAKSAAKGCLIEHGKLIINITNEDLICMIKRKQEGYEVSEYLFDKVEDFLMSISK